MSLPESKPEETPLERAEQEINAMDRDQIRTVINRIGGVANPLTDAEHQRLAKDYILQRIEIIKRHGVESAYLPSFIERRVELLEKLAEVDQHIRLLNS